MKNYCKIPLHMNLTWWRQPDKILLDNFSRYQTFASVTHRSTLYQIRVSKTLDNFWKSICSKVFLFCAMNFNFAIKLLGPIDHKILFYRHGEYIQLNNALIIANFQTINVRKNSKKKKHANSKQKERNVYGVSHCFVSHGFGLFTSYKYSS